MITLDAGQYII